MTTATNARTRNCSCDRACYSLVAHVEGSILKFEIVVDRNTIQQRTRSEEISVILERSIDHLSPRVRDMWTGCAGPRPNVQSIRRMALC